MNIFLYGLFSIIMIMKENNSVAKYFRKNVIDTKDVNLIIWSCSFQQAILEKFELKLQICHFQICFYLILVSSQINMVRWRYITSQPSAREIDNLPDTHPKVISRSLISN